MERTFDAVAHHFSAVSEVRAEMTAVPGHDVQFIGIVAVGDESLPEVVQGTALSGFELLRPADHEPARDLPRERYFQRILLCRAGGIQLERCIWELR